MALSIYSENTLLSVSEVFTTTSFHIVVLRVVTPCSFIEEYTAHWLQ